VNGRFINYEITYAKDDRSLKDNVIHTEIPLYCKGRHLPARPGLTHNLKFLKRIKHNRTHR
jgi:hypothetical protein